MKPLDPDEIESILGGEAGGDASARLARLVRTARSEATPAELSREDLAVAAFRQHVVIEPERRRVFSRFTPAKIAVAAAAFVAVGGGFTAALTHALTNPSHATIVPTITKAPSASKAGSSQPSVSQKSQPTITSQSGSNQSSAQKSGGNQQSSAQKGGATNKSTTGSQGTSRGNGTMIAPGQTGAAVPSSYRGLCVSYQHAVGAAGSSVSNNKAISKLQSSKKFLRLAETALQRGMTVPQFCSQVVQPAVPSSVPGFGSSHTSTGTAPAAKSPQGGESSTNSDNHPSNGGSGSSNSNSGNGGGGGIVSAGTPPKLP